MGGGVFGRSWALLNVIDQRGSEKLRAGANNLRYLRATQATLAARESIDPSIAR